MDYKIEKIVEIDVDSENLEEELYTGVETVSLVTDPAIEVDFLAFRKEFFIDPRAGESEDEFVSRCMGSDQMISEYPDEDQRLAVCYSIYEKFSFAQHSFSVHEEKRMVTGPLMIPNKMIPRKDPEGNYYYVYFSKKSIASMAEKFIRENHQNKTNINHDGNLLETNTLVESWISLSTKEDKSYKLGYALPPGTWFVTYKINDEETWQKIKSKEIKGFSLEGTFKKPPKKQVIQNDEVLLNRIKEILKNVED